MKWLNQLLCGMSGHDYLFHFDEGRVYLKCQTCTKESSGWQDTGACYRVTQPGDPNRHILQREKVA